ncbi:fibronectin type III-like domain-contianing protein [Goodfellowiella coeruleoviolacea]|uniref:fibronectin type III-like domain-contianing protein n=1 Tax=Goodfellowiella coeruleoviolacea TaxID=334858 RepID=UPI002646611D|nr:fibronectin type III-like domain-contianing protein [Goodfellowiella coeruleoviolacea]
MRGFQRVEVAAHGSAVVELPVGAEQLSTVDGAGRPRLAAGIVELQTGTSAADLAGVRLTLTG